MNKLRLLVLAIALPVFSWAQNTDTLIHKLDSLDKKQDTIKPVINIEPEAYNDETKLTLKSYFLLLGSDIKQEFTKPFHMKKKDWGNFAKYALVAGALSFADKPIQRNALHWRNTSSNVRSTGKFISNFGASYELYTLAAFGAYGVIF